MRKHFFAIVIILLVLGLGYGMWLYNESLKTGKDFHVILKQDLAAKREFLEEIKSK
jgi:uncharacterized membrane protein YqjE